MNLTSYPIIIGVHAMLYLQFCYEHHAYVGIYLQGWIFKCRTCYKTQFDWFLKIILPMHCNGRSHPYIKKKHARTLTMQQPPRNELREGIKINYTCISTFVYNSLFEAYITMLVIQKIYIHLTCSLIKDTIRLLHLTNL